MRLRIDRRRLSAALGGLALVALAACGPNGTSSGTPAGRPVEWVEIEGTVSLDDLDLDAFMQGAGDAAPESVSLAEAQARLPFAVALPAWVPEGFSVLDEVEVVQGQAEAAPAYASVIVTWEDDAGASLDLQIATAGQGQARLGSAEGGEAASVNGAPATLARSHRTGSERLTLSWTRASLAYQLSAEGEAVSADDLLRVANSIP